MKVAVLSPVGPDHERFIPRAFSSAVTAWRADRGPFTGFEHFFFDDRRAYYGRALARNHLLARARSWGADWIINLDVTDLIHPLAFRAIGAELERDPRLGHICGCHSMILRREVALLSARDGAELEPDASGLYHVYRTRFDICPMSWDDVMENQSFGTSGTLTATRADVAWKIGFLPELPAGDVWEWTLCVMASTRFVKVPRPIVVIDRVTPGSGRGSAGSISDHADTLEVMLEVLTEHWKQRGRVPLTYSELEERWRSRFRRRRDFEVDVPVLEKPSDVVAVEPGTGRVLTVDDLAKPSGGRFYVSS